MHPVQKVLPTHLQRQKEEKRKITMLSIYDYALAVLADRAGLDTILVGDFTCHDRARLSQYRGCLSR